MDQSTLFRALLLLLTPDLGLPVLAQDASALDEEKGGCAHSSRPLYSPYAQHIFPDRPYFGDAHLHTPPIWYTSQHGRSCYDFIPS